MYELTHASFFSGVGGLDLGLERAGWRTVSFSEIDPYASTVLTERWPRVPNLGDITVLSTRSVRQERRRGRLDGDGAGQYADPAGRQWERTNSAAWQHAALWSGGFPCQDLSVAGKRAGFAGARSSLAFAFLDLVERHRPPAILLENVPGLLSSNAGRDFGRLLREMGELGYWWAYRVLDARHFGVPQRRRRVFIVGLHAGTGLGADSAAAVLSVGTRCPRHPATGHTTGEGAPERFSGGPPGAGILDQSVSAKWSKQAGGPAGDEHHNLTLGATPDPGGVREADGLAGRLDDSPLAYRKAARVSDPGSAETWVDDGLANTLNSFDVGDIRTTHIAIGREGSNGPKGAATTCPPDLLPLGLDSHRYRCCGNGVVANVAEYIGWRLREAVEAMRAAA